MNYTTIFCPQCGNPSLYYSAWPSCVDGWEVMMANCHYCDYDVIRGFRRIGGEPDIDGIISIKFTDPIDLSAFRKDEDCGSV